MTKWRLNDDIPEQHASFTLEIHHHFEYSQIINFLIESSLVKTLINVSNGVLVILLVRRYEVIYNQMLIKMPLTACWLSGRRISE